MLLNPKGREGCSRNIPGFPYHFPYQLNHFISSLKSQVKLFTGVFPVQNTVRKDICEHIASPSYDNTPSKLNLALDTFKEGKQRVSLDKELVPRLRPGPVRQQGGLTLGCVPAAVGGTAGRLWQRRSEQGGPPSLWWPRGPPHRS